MLAVPISYSKTTPVAGVLFKLTPAVNLYANAGKGFETPTLIEMAYSPGGGGFNFNLQPATSNNYEIGAKAFLGLNTRANIAFFKIDTDNEIVVADNTSGRASYQNAGSTERMGAELSVDSDFGNGGTNRKGHILWLAYAPRDYVQFKVKYFMTRRLNPYLSTTGAPITTPVFSDINRLQCDVVVKF